MAHTKSEPDPLHVILAADLLLIKTCIPRACECPASIEVRYGSGFHSLDANEDYVGKHGLVVKGLEHFIGQSEIHFPTAW